MKKSLMVRSATLGFAIGSFIFLVGHASLGAGCIGGAKSSLRAESMHAQAGHGAHEGANALAPIGAMSAQANPNDHDHDHATGDQAATESEKGKEVSPREEPPPSYLGATKAAPVFHPQLEAPFPQKSASANASP